MLRKDRDAQNVYLLMVEFSAYDQAMENSSRPETAAFAAFLADISDSPLTFRNSMSYARKPCEDTLVDERAFPESRVHGVRYLRVQAIVARTRRINGIQMTGAPTAPRV